MTKFQITGLDVDHLDNDSWANALAALTTQQYLTLLEVEQGPFKGLEPAEEVPLIGLRDAIETLLAHGARSADFREIYCEYCNFFMVKSLDGADFAGAFLAMANFRHVSLRGASFRNADIGGTSFFGADLTNSDLQLDLLPFPLLGRDLIDQIPLFECATLNGADLSGQPLLVFVKCFGEETGAHYQVKLPRMGSVKIDAHTKLKYFRILAATFVSDAYLDRHPAADEVRHLTKDRLLGWKYPLLKMPELALSSPRFRRVHRPLFSGNPSESTYTVAEAEWSFGSSDLANLGRDAFILRGVVDQPALRSLSLYSSFADALKALDVPNTPEAKAALDWNKEATKKWAALKPFSCNEQPGVHELRFDANID